MSDQLAAELTEAWETNHRINTLVIDACSPDALTASLSMRGGRDVARQFAHLHHVRIAHLEKRSKELADGLQKFDSKYSPTADELKSALQSSTDRVATLLGDILAGKPGRRGFKKGIFTTLSYFIAHESHHRGSIFLTLKQSGMALPKEVAYGIWDWDRR